jgi:hypothetical protein
MHPEEGCESTVWHRLRMATRVATVGAVACLCLAGCGGSSPSSGVPSTQVKSTTPAETTSRSTTNGAVRPRRPHHRGPSPGSLPQTDERPSAATRSFHAEMRALWEGVRTGSLRLAMPAFFPEGAYLQLKTIYAAGGDYRGRLVGDYQLDVEAAHSLLGAHAQDARLLEVLVPGAYAHWVDPQVCDNRVGYYEVPNARVVYREDGQVRSFGIASMISWRGVWYVIHLGAVVRDVVAGVVNDPSAGTGASTASSTC